MNEEEVIQNLERLAAMDYPTLKRDLSSDIMNQIYKSQNKPNNNWLINSLIASNVALMLTVIAVLFITVPTKQNKDSQLVSINVPYQEIIGTTGYVNLFVNIADTKKISLAKSVQIANIRNINATYVTLDAIVDSETARKIAIAKQNHSIEAQALTTYNAYEKEISPQMVSLKDPYGRIISNDIPKSSNVVLIIPDQNTGSEVTHILKNGFWIREEV